MAVVLAIGITFSAINGFYKRKLDRIEESYTVQIQEINDRAIVAEQHADSVDFIVAQYEQSMDSINKVKEWYRWDRDRLENELIDAWNHIFDADIDENYTMLQNRYPTNDTLKYPFSGEQVKGIALDLIRLDYKDSMINNQKKVIELIRIQLNKSGAMIIELDKERHDLEYLNAQLLRELAIRTEELKISEEEFAELKRKLRVRTAGGVGTIVALAALIILL